MDLRRASNNSVETVNAAAVAIISSENRVRQIETPPRRKWTACFSISCFRWTGRTGRVNQAALVPEPAQPTPNQTSPANPSLTHPPSLHLPLTAPPSSPASSLLQSSTASAAHSPAVMPLSLSPTGPSSIFAIGPYAHETQLVSPPVFSTFTTESSTAPFTPPPESVHLTTPSSPEVPFAQLLSSSFNSDIKKNEGIEFSSYQFHPGSPIGPLISPNSGCSGNSSPFREISYHPFPVCEPPKILLPNHARKDGSLLDGRITAAVPPENSDHRRLSFELETEETENTGLKSVARGEESGKEKEGNHDLPEKSGPSISRGPSKEFKFDNSDGGEPGVGSEWWTNETVGVGTGEPRKNWPFYPMVEPGVS